MKPKHGGQFPMEEKSEEGTDLSHKTPAKQRDHIIPSTYLMKR